MGILRRLLRWCVTWRPVYWLFRRQPGVTVTVSRVTSPDGETLQLTTTAPVLATAMELGNVAESLSLACQMRMIRQNEIMLTSRVEISAQKYQRVKKKLDDAEAHGRKGVGVLSREERKWWLEHKDDFDEEGNIRVGVDVEKAALDP